ncbi:MAG: ATP synthase subunit I [Betaproteobacteria bacterium]|nr:ATP synthase subunit I [Betaproteobacteria bacterium]
MLRIQSKPVRTVLVWQIVVTVVLAVIAGLLAGIHGAASAALGGSVSVAAGLAFAIVMQSSNMQSADGTIVAALRAEASKIGLAVILLWLVLALYKDVVLIVFIGSFIFSILIFSMAFFVRDV